MWEQTSRSAQPGQTWRSAPTNPFFHTLSGHIGLDLSSAPTGEAAGVSGAAVTVRYAVVTLRLHDGVSNVEWPARVAFAPLPSRRALLGIAGFLQFFDALFKGEDEEVELTTNGLFPTDRHGF